LSSHHIVRYKSDGQGGWKEPLTLTKLEALLDGGSFSPGAFVLSRNGKTAYFTDDYWVAHELYTTSRVNLDDDWSAPEWLPTAPTPGSTVNPPASTDFAYWISPDELRLYMSSRPQGGTDTNAHIFVAPNIGRAFGEPVKLGYSSIEEYPVLSQDESRLYFFAPSGASRHMWTATRNPDKTYGLPAKVNEVATGLAPSWLSDDQCTMLLFGPVQSDPDIWIAKHPPNP
jgi:hypothetical protein